jgi:hypothetical protein
MANNGREFKRERPFGQDADRQPGDTTESKYGDHPILGNDKQPLGKELQRSPERSAPDPMTRPPAPPGVSKVIPIQGPAQPHNPDVDYQPPNPMAVVPPANASVKLLGTVVALLLFAVVLWFLFHNWMTPGARHPGEQKQGQELQQKIP